MSDPNQPDPGQPTPGPPPAGYGTPPQYGAPPQWGYAPVPSGGPPGTYYDEDSELWIPEGTTLASRGRRIGAGFLSIALSLVTLYIGYIIWGLIVWGRGQTPALQVLGMRCYNPDEAKVAGWGRMALREIVGRLVEDIVGWVTMLISFIIFLARSDRKALHDLIGGTIVLHDPNKVLAPQK